MFRTFQTYIKEFYGIRVFVPKIDHVTGRYCILDYDDSTRRSPPPAVQIVLKTWEGQRRQRRSRQPKSSASKDKRRNRKRRITLVRSAKQKAEGQIRPFPSGANGSRRWRRSKEFRMAAHESPNDSPIERTDVEHSSYSSPSNDDEPENLQESIAPQLRYAPEWFRLVQRMVLKEGMDDYELSYYSHSQSILFMVVQGWIDLTDVVTWGRARVELGQALVDNMNSRGGFRWMIDSNGPCTPIPLTEDEATLFHAPWQVCRDTKMLYDWKRDRAERRRYGPFGERVAKYATPSVQEKVLKELLKLDLDIDKVDLPGNWRTLFEPLFWRKCAGSSGSGPSYKMETDVESNGASKFHRNEGDEDMKRKLHGAVEDADNGGSGVDDGDESDDNSSKRLQSEEKGKWKAYAPGIPEDASISTTAIVLNAIDTREPTLSSGVSSGPGSLVRHPDAFNGMIADTEQPAPFQAHEMWNYPQAIVSQSSFLENGFNFDHSADVDMEDVVSNSYQSPAFESRPEAIVDLNETEMSLDETEPVQELPSTWSTTNNVDMAPPTSTSVVIDRVFLSQAQTQDHSQPPSHSRPHFTFGSLPNPGQSQSQQPSSQGPPVQRLAKLKRQQKREEESRKRYARKEPQYTCPCGFVDVSQWHVCPLQHVLIE